MVPPASICAGFQIMRSLPPFRPLPFLANRHVQTILASQLNLTLEPPSVTRMLTLPDADRLALEVSTPLLWPTHAPTVIMVHGLCGCHRSPYMIRMARKLWRHGLRVVRLNLRGCGSGKGHARHPYHSGRSEDIRAALEALLASTPLSPMTLIGFSLGGNLVLKLASEANPDALPTLRQVLAVCPPADLATCAALLSQPSNRLYEQRFIRLLRADVRDRQKAFPDTPPVTLPNPLSIYEFDNLYTAPRCGFRDADAYYARCSAAPLVPRITLPCRILLAKDDPFIDATVFDGVHLPAHVRVTRTERGGHLGFLGFCGPGGGFRWMDNLLLKWIEDAHDYRYSAVVSHHNHA
jgi:predicted alpha/beta-fold hydrolase